jgi:hypothetical protein
MRKIVLFIILSAMPLFSPGCLLSPNTEFVERNDTLEVDTLKIHDTLHVRDTIKLYDTTYLLNATSSGAPNLFRVVQYNLDYNVNTFSYYMEIAWCPVPNAIGYQVYYSTSVNSGYSKAPGTPFASTNDTTICGSGKYMLLRILFWTNGIYAGTGLTGLNLPNGSYYFKVVPILDNGLQGKPSNIKAGYFIK